MSKFSRVRFRLFVAGNVHTVVFLPIFFFWFCWCFCCLYCFWSLLSVFICLFWRNLLVDVSMHRRNLEWWHVFLLLFLTHTVCLHHLWQVRPYVSSKVFFLFSGPFIKVLSSYPLRMILNILQVDKLGVYLFDEVSAM